MYQKQVQVGLLSTALQKLKINTREIKNKTIVEKISSSEGFIPNSPCHRGEEARREFNDFPTITVRKKTGAKY